MKRALELNWAVRKRLEFIEYCLVYDGFVNRSNLVNEFDISIPQASKDLSMYRKLAPKNMVYDLSLKTYLIGAKYKAIFR